MLNQVVSKTLTRPDGRRAIEGLSRPLLINLTVPTGLERVFSVPFAQDRFFE